MPVSFIIADESQLLKMPYRPGKGLTSPNIGFIDLKAHPERLDEIPELKNNPELKELVSFLNQPDSVFATLRTDSAKNIVKAEDYSNSDFSHLTVSFAAPNPKDDARYYEDLFKAFENRIESLNLPRTIIYKFVLIPVEIKQFDFRGHCLDIWLYGLGNSETEAKTQMVSGLRFLQSFLMEANENIKHQ